MKHEIKIWPQYFCRVKDGSKTFEVRENDRGFQPGDTVILKEYDPEIIEKSYDDPMGGGYYKEPRGYLGGKLEFKIGYVLPIENNKVVFSLLPMEQK